MYGRDRFYGVLLATTTASFISPFTTSSITVALPILAEEFSVGLAEVNWVVNVYLIALASTILVFGVIGDWLGRSRIFIAGIAMFAITSSIMVIVHDYLSLLVFRLLQGLAASMISSTAVAILSELLPIERRGMGIGLNTMAVYIGLTLGPLIGGYITNYFGWRTLFILKAFIAFMSLSLAITLPKTSRGVSVKPNFKMSALIVSSIIMIIYGASNINSSYGVIMASLGLMALTSTLLMERRSPKLIHPMILRRKPLSANISALLNYSATYALTILLSSYLQKLRGLNPSEAGLILTTQSIFQATLSPITGLLADKYNPSILASMGMFTITFGIIGLTQINPTTPINQIIYTLIILGVGFAFFSSPNTTAIMNMSPKEAYGSTSALLATMRFLGQAISTSITTSIMNIQGDLMTTIKTSMAIYTILSILGALLSLTAGMEKPRKLFQKPILTILTLHKHK
ncbi:MAG: MFS transporter [archaeon YNP-LCB-003-016]|uniref:MFS transporter n=1 Tax=Candidatus Culexarchaeum yellowstonense TaxID=2928963 RepID=UPI0026EBF1BE|nr:MFS transporter [Candidatus Culexarchaeum yellowstonense]MCR6692107.1 MFS transporter [Candidatus Culexarchaeum yellowstonense]